MKNRLTYRDLTLLLGVLVAAIVLFTMLLRSPDRTAAAKRTIQIPLPKAPSPSSVLKTAISIFERH